MTFPVGIPPVVFSEGLTLGKGGNSSRGTRDSELRNVPTTSVFSVLKVVVS